MSLSNYNIDSIDIKGTRADGAQAIKFSQKMSQVGCATTRGKLVDPQELNDFQLVEYEFRPGYGARDMRQFLTHFNRLYADGSSSFNINGIYVLTRQ